MELESKADNLVKSTGEKEEILARVISDLESKNRHLHSAMSNMSSEFQVTLLSLRNTCKHKANFSWSSHTKCLTVVVLCFTPSLPLREPVMAMVDPLVFVHNKRPHTFLLCVIGNL